MKKSFNSTSYFHNTEKLNKHGQTEKILHDLSECCKTGVDDARQPCGCIQTKKFKIKILKSNLRSRVTYDLMPHWKPKHTLCLPPNIQLHEILLTPKTKP
jgi:hypothetical protein